MRFTDWREGGGAVVAAKAAEPARPLPGPRLGSPDAKGSAAPAAPKVRQSRRKSRANRENAHKDQENKEIPERCATTASASHGRILPRRRPFLPGAVCRAGWFAQLARRLRPLPVMTAVRFTISFKNKALSRGAVVRAGQKTLQGGQGLPGRARQEAC